MDSARYYGARRGVFGLESWSLPREPGKPDALPVNLVNRFDGEQVNAAASGSPLFNSDQHSPQQQQLPYAAQPTMLLDSDRRAEQAASSFAENANASKPRKLLVSCFHLCSTNSYCVTLC